MNTGTAQQQIAAMEVDDGSRASKNPLPRDQEQSHLLHEPSNMTNSIDPISGRDIMPMAGHPSLNDGILTIYFESEETRSEFLNTPLNEPYHRLPGSPSDEDDRGG